MTSKLEQLETAKENYLLTHKGVDVHVYIWSDHVYMKATLEQMGERVNVAQWYQLNMDDYTPNEYNKKLEDLMDEFISFYEGCR